MDKNARSILLGATAGLVVVLLVLAAVGIRPIDGTSTGNNGNGRGNGNGNGNGQGQGRGQDKDKDDKTPQIDITLEGTVEESTDDQGEPAFTMTVDGTTWVLSAGPAWYWGDDNPLAAVAGETAAIAGSHQEGETDLSVVTIDGTAIREPGKPPWAGGPNDKPDKNQDDESEPTD